MENKENYDSQKKHLATKKQLRVWMEPEKLDAFKAAVAKNGSSMYSVVHEFIDEYIEKTKLD